MIDINALKQAMQQGVENYLRDYFSPDRPFWNHMNPLHGTKGKNRAIKVKEYAQQLGQNENGILTLAVAVMVGNHDGSTLQGCIRSQIIELNVFDDIKQKVFDIHSRCLESSQGAASAPDSMLNEWAIEELLTEASTSRGIPCGGQKMDAIIANLNDERTVNTDLAFFSTELSDMDTCQR